MKQIAAIACLSLALLQSSDATEPPSAQDQQLAAVIKEIQAQQALIAANQAKIDAKLGTIAEVVRVARIFASRGGK
jgi:hypothetical protein